MSNEIAEQCGCYKLINLLVFMQQLCSIYLVKNYPPKGSAHSVCKYVNITTLIFSLLGLIGAIGAFTYNDYLIVLYATLLIIYSITLALTCSYLLRIGSAVSDFHYILLIVSLLFASLSFTTLTTKHTYSEWLHSEQVIDYYTKQSS